MKHELYIFGSATRGEVTQTSDLDVLVVPLNGQGRMSYPFGWSCYKESSLRRMHSEGRLFAWHLFLDSLCVYSDRSTPLIKELGPPAQYGTAHKDITDLAALLNVSLSELSAGTPNQVYELGIVHTCLRDIAMSASWHLLHRPTYSQMAPYALELDFPLAEADYRCLMLARHASTRGVEAAWKDETLANRVLASDLTGWVAEIEAQLR